MRIHKKSSIFALAKAFRAAKVQHFSDMTKIELLAPARDLTVGRAAIDSGADAVYIGAPRFGARQAAGNSLEDIRALCDYAHLFEVRVWVTLNTLLTDEEIPEAEALAWQLYEAGIDGLIIQDLRLLTRNLPPIRLHASTQCDNRTVERVQELEALGMKRVVLARELSLSEIKAIREQTNIELEAFIHGALCVSYSGQCYLSEHVCGRSANRGACAQLCRQKYDVLDKDGNILVRNKHILSLHDMNRSDSIAELLAAGVTSLKIEGRLKDASYVRNVVAYYRQLLDRFFADNPTYCRASKGVHTWNFTPNPTKTFHRGGIDYFLHGRTSQMANFETPKSTGEYIGKMTERGLRLAEGIELHNGDGLTYGDTGFYWPSKLTDIAPETLLYRNYDKAFQDALEAPNACTRKLPVTILFRETEDGFSLQIGETICSFSYEKQDAKNALRAEQTVREQLSKLGDTPFLAEEVKIEWTKPYFLPISILNDWRRQVVEKSVSHKVVSRESFVLCPSSFVHKTEPALMTCRYCLLYEMGYCRKINRTEQEPAFIRTSSKTFRLVFDCKRCEMSIYPLG